MIARKQQPTNSAVGRHVINRMTGERGRITDIERHKSDPYVRYTVKYADDETLGGQIAGKDIRILSFDEVEAAGLDGTLRS